MLFSVQIHQAKYTDQNIRNINGSAERVGDRWRVCHRNYFLITMLCVPHCFYLCIIWLWHLFIWSKKTVFTDRLSQFSTFCGSFVGGDVKTALKTANCFVQCWTQTVTIRLRVWRQNSTCWSKRISIALQGIQNTGFMSFTMAIYAPRIN